MRFVEVFLYLMIMIFIGVHAIKTMLQRSSPEVFVMQLFVLGFALLLLLVEVQNRYVIVAFPYLILLGAVGLEESLGKNLVPHTNS